jgi:hypothetical protein
MRKWDWDMHDLIDATETCHKVEQRGKMKLNVWTRKGGSKKLVLAYYPDEREVLVITGTEGRA